MKKMISFMLATVITISMMTIALVSASAATDNTKIRFQFPEDKGTAYVSLIPTDSSKSNDGQHGYGNNPDTWTYIAEDADYVKITFDEQTYVEEGCDRVIIYDKDDSIVGRYTGDSLAGKTICIPGHKVTVRVVSNKIIADPDVETVCNVNIVKVSYFRLEVESLDDETSIATVTSIQRYLAGKEELTPAAIKVADCNDDGKVTIADVTALQRHFAEVIK